MKSRIIAIIRNIFSYVILGFSVIIGLMLYRVFMVYSPGADINDLFVKRIGISAFHFLGLSSGILISFPIIFVAILVFERFSTAYVRVKSDKGLMFLSEFAIQEFISDTVGNIKGVQDVQVKVDIFKDNRVGVNLWLETDEKSDFIRFLERVRQRVIQDMEYNFGINSIRFFNVYLETTDINSEGKRYKVNYK